VQLLGKLAKARDKDAVRVVLDRLLERRALALGGRLAGHGRG